MQAHTRARRRFLQATVSTGVLSVAAAAGLLRPVAAHAQFPFLNFRTPRQAAQPPAAAPVAVPDTRLTPLQRLLRDLRQARPENSTSVDILSPEIAVDGASIMLDFQALLPEVDAFAVYIDGNPQPLAAAFHLADNVLPEIRLMVRLAQSSSITVIARSQGRFYRHARFVKVTHGGCSDSFDEVQSRHRQEVQRQYRATP